MVLRHALGRVPGPGVVAASALHQEAGAEKIGAGRGAKLVGRVIVSCYLPKCGRLSHHKGREIMLRTTLVRMLVGICCFVMPFMVGETGIARLWAAPTPAPPLCTGSLPDKTTGKLCEANPQQCTYGDAATCNANAGDYNLQTVYSACVNTQNPSDYCGDGSAQCAQKYTCAWNAVPPGVGCRRALPLYQNNQPVYVYVTAKVTGACTLPAP